MLRRRTGMARILTAGCLAMVWALGGCGDGSNSPGFGGVWSPQTKPYGQTYGEWAAQWWKWALSFPADENPMLDPTGAFGDQGQSGPVWFLAGTWGEDTERTVVVPSRKALFFPILNKVWISTEPGDPQTAEGIRAIVKPIIDSATDMVCQIGDVTVDNLPRFRTESPLFEVALPANNVYGIAEGTYGPSLDQGFYLMVAPLRAGQHTIHFSGVIPAGPGHENPSALDMTYHLTVQ